MPRFFIDLRDGDAVVKDAEGAIYNYIEDALEDARNSSGELARRYRGLGISENSVCVEIRDVQGRTVVTLTVGEVLGNRTPSDRKSYFAPSVGRH